MLKYESDHQFSTTVHPLCIHALSEQQRHVDACVDYILSAVAGVLRHLSNTEWWWWTAEALLQWWHALAVEACDLPFFSWRVLRKVDWLRKIHELVANERMILENQRRCQCQNMRCRRCRTESLEERQSIPCDSQSVAAKHQSNHQEVLLGNQHPASAVRQAYYNEERL